MATYYVFLVIFGTMVYGMKELSIGGEIRGKRFDGLVHDVVRQMVAEHIERMKIMKVFRHMKNDLQDVKRELKERNKLIHEAKFLQRKLLRKINDVKKEVTETSMAVVKKAIKGYDMKVKTVTKGIKNCEKSIKFELSDTKKEVFNIQKSLKHLQNATGQNKVQIAFTAKLHNDVATSSVIKFQSVITNVGGGYNDSVGIFYTPKAGLYLFSASMMAYNSNYVDAYIMKNYNKMLRIHENIKIIHYPSATGTVLLQLLVGDKVWVKGSGIKYHNSITSFAGTLIK